MKLLPELVLEYLQEHGVATECLQKVQSALCSRMEMLPLAQHHDYHQKPRLQEIFEHSTEGKIEVTVRALSGNIYLVEEVSTGTSVRELKSLIEAKILVPVPQLRLVFRGELLDDDTTVASCGVGPLEKELSCVIVPPSEIYVIGGIADEEPVSSVEVWSPLTQKWSSVPSMQTPRLECSAATVGGCIYVLGGAEAGAGDGASGEVFDPTLGEWRSLPPMPRPRRNFQLASIDRKLFVIGGFNGGIVASAEVLDTDTLQWSEIPSMTVARSDFGLACVDRALYAVGGCDGQTVVSSAEVLDTESDIAWRSLPPMQQARCYFVATALGTKLYAIGGQALGRALTSCEVFDVVSEVWTSIAPLQVPRRYSASGVVDGKIYLLGGRDGTAFLTSTEVYDPEEGTWSMSATMAVPRRGCANITSGDQIYMLGGRDASRTPIAMAQAFDTALGMWIDLPDMLTSRRSFAVAVA